LWVLVLLFTGFAGFRYGFGKAVDKIIDKDVVEIDGFALVLEPVVILFIITSRVCSELYVVRNLHGNKVVGLLQFGHDVCGAAKLSTVYAVLREDLQCVDVHTDEHDHDGAYKHQNFSHRPFHGSKLQIFPEDHVWGFRLVSFRLVIFG
jgi:hypothetical protein